jgi:dipeptidyl aminopeptidase/acylaminoacyl peptidase
MRRSILILVLSIWASATVSAQKIPLDHSVYDGWRSVQDRAISNDGKWLLYSLSPQEGDATQEIKAVDGRRTISIPRGRAGQFSFDTQFAVSQIKPPFLLARQATRDKKKPEDMPKDTLAIVRLNDGNVLKIGRVKSFAMPEKSAGWVAYLMEKPIVKPDTSKKAENAPKELPKKEDKKDDKKKTEKKKDEGTPLVLRNLGSGTETSFQNVSSYLWAKNGSRLIFATSAADSLKDGIFALNMSTSKVDTLLMGRGNYKQLAIDEQGNQIAFLTDRDDYKAKKSAFNLYFWQNTGKARLIADSTTAAFPKGWRVSENGNLNFSKNGSKLYFGSAPKPLPDPKEVPDDEKVSVDVWHWQDPQIQPMQLVQAEQEKKRSYRAVFHISAQKVVQLATEDMPNLATNYDGNAEFAIGSSQLPYQFMNWETPGFSDVYLVRVQDGTRTKVMEKVQFGVQLSPNAQFMYWWDGQAKAWFAQAVTQSVNAKEAKNLTASIPLLFADDQFDQPMLPSPASYSVQWTDQDASMIVGDGYDLWELDPTGSKAPRSITEGKGREGSIRFNLLNFDSETPNINPNKPYILSAFHELNKSAGFYRDQVNGSDAPKSLLWSANRYNMPIKAKNADVVMWTRESFQETPNIWTSNIDFRNAKQHSDANPQQSKYLWGTAEVVSWRSTDNVMLQGLLYKPENFDPAKKYPMMVYFYERLSDGLHTYISPAPGSSSINVAFYVSRGYLVFEPDIPYEIGYPGESAMDAIMPGVLSLMEKGFIDPQRVGAQGHSWGGYQIAYMITKTNLFRAVEAGAAVSNMTSAYGGIRWGTGMSRQFQYERTQSRIGGTLWQNSLQYIENSPLFWAEKVKTPLLMMHNDQDDAVPWYQGIEYYMALRRLNKPVWMLTYNGEFHGLRKRQDQKDWAIRMQQYFDHYLKDAPTPVWMSKGVPAIQKGLTKGLETE